MAKKHRIIKGAAHVGISRKTINGCPEFDELSGTAKILYLKIKARFNGVNNGHIKLTYADMKNCRGCLGSATLSRAANELESKGWILRPQRGALFRYKTLYGLTFKYDQYAKPIE